MLKIFGKRTPSHAVLRTSLRPETRMLISLRNCSGCSGMAVPQYYANLPCSGLTRFINRTCKWASCGPMGLGQHIQEEIRESHKLERWLFPRRCTYTNTQRGGGDQSALQPMHFTQGFEIYHLISPADAFSRLLCIFYDAHSKKLQAVTYYI